MATKILPLGDCVYIKLDEQKAGVLDTSSRTSAIEVGVVVALGPEVKPFKGLEVGAKVLFKSWGVDSTNYEGKPLHFISQSTNAILAVVK